MHPRSGNTIHRGGVLDSDSDIFFLRDISHNPFAYLKKAGAQIKFVRKLVGMKGVPGALSLNVFVKVDVEEAFKVVDVETGEEVHCSVHPGEEPAQSSHVFVLTNTFGASEDGKKQLACGDWTVTNINNTLHTAVQSADIKTFMGNIKKPAMTRFAAAANVFLTGLLMFYFFRFMTRGASERQEREATQMGTRHAEESRRQD